MSGETKAADRRSWKRFFLSLSDGTNTCRVRDDRGQAAWVRVLNISVGGAQLRLVEGEPLRFEESQELSFEECDVDKWGRHLCGAGGFVRWVTGDGECGCQFFEPLGAQSGK